MVTHTSCCCGLSLGHGSLGNPQGFWAISSLFDGGLSAFPCLGSLSCPKDPYKTDIPNINSSAQGSGGSDTAQLIPRHCPKEGSLGLLWCIYYSTYVPMYLGAYLGT